MKKWRRIESLEDFLAITSGSFLEENTIPLKSGMVEVVVGEKASQEIKKNFSFANIKFAIDTLDLTTGGNWVVEMSIFASGQQSEDLKLEINDPFEEKDLDFKISLPVTELRSLAREDVDSTGFYRLMLYEAIRKRQVKIMVEADDQSGLVSVRVSIFGRETETVFSRLLGQFFLNRLR